MPKSGYFGTCTITGRSGRRVAVNSLMPRALPIPERFGDYADFVQDLHARLDEDDRRRIRFNAGVTPGRQMLGPVAAFLGGAFFFVLPLVLLL